VDGARIDFGDGWGLVRASNTTPLLVLRFEADTEPRLAEIRGAVESKLVDVMKSVVPA
jgi:phosphomannomutase/phosphoglucomutase